MKKSKLFMLLIISSILLISSTKGIVYADTTVSSIARGMIVIEGNTDTVLYDYNSCEKLPMASTTKIMTAIVCIEKCQDLDKKIIVNDNAVGIEGTSIYLKYNEEISIRDLLYGLILASGNDCSIAIAEYIGGSTANFVDMMNNKVEELNLKNTHFDNPHGLDSDTHYTTAYDLAIITSYSMKNDVFREIVSTKRYTISSTNVSEPRYLKHKNKLMFQDENCIGVKTGFTDNARRCLVSAYEYENMMIISVVLNCQPMFEECDRLTSMVKDNYKMVEFIKPYNYVSNINIENGDKNEVGLITIKGYCKPILKKEEMNYHVEYDIPNNIYAPVDLNQPIGTVAIYYKNDIIYKDDLYTIESSENTDLKYQIDKIIQNWF